MSRVYLRVDMDAPPRTIRDLNSAGVELIAAAQMLVEGFAGTGTKSWPDLESATEEVLQSLGPQRLSRIAVDADGTVLGWIGGRPQYDGHVWELHPLVVRADARRRGGLTIVLGTDDENERTSIGGVDLYPGVLDKLARIRDLRGHPFAFYARVGFEVVGVIPDANGFGKPDILMAKRVGEPNRAELDLPARRNALNP